jgi:sugar/nucleoside kinase (ribokinase family)
MTSPRFDLLCLGNAIVDVLSTVENDFLVSHGVAKGSMTLIDEPRAEQIFNAMGPATVISGGSAANTAVGAASLGVRAAFIGKVRNDEVGRLFTHDIRATGVHFATEVAVDGPATARSFILVTPDGQRSMNTYLGACQGLETKDVDADLVRASAITYLEGYLWDPPAAKDAFKRAATIAHEAGRKVAITLSDSFCVDRYRDEFLDLIRSRTVDIVFANEAELHALYQTADFDAAVSAMREQCELAVVTRGAEGSLVISREGAHAYPAASIDALIDTTGAGDLFAAGFLGGLARGADHRTSAALGALAAAEVIQHIGARPQKALAALAAAEGLRL